jgi:hypothetical protein
MSDLPNVSRNEACAAFGAFGFSLDRVLCGKRRHASRRNSKGSRTVWYESSAAAEPLGDPFWLSTVVSAWAAGAGGAVVLIFGLLVAAVGARPPEMVALTIGRSANGVDAEPAKSTSLVLRY